MRNSRLENDSFPGLLNEARTATSTAGGLGLTTAAAVVGFPQGTSHVSLFARSFTTAVVAKVALNPYLLIMKSADRLVSATDYSAAAQNNPVGTGAILSALSTLAAGEAFYVGSHVQFRGIAVDMLGGSVNGNTAVLLAEYWNGTGWVSLSATDGTTSGGKTFAVDGNITWTVPSAWTKEQLSQTRQPAPQNPPNNPTQIGTLLPYNNQKQYWVRLSVSAALSATVVASSMFSLNRSTAYAQLTESSYLQFRTTMRPGGTACVEALTDAGTASLIVNAYTDNPLGVFS